MSNYSLVADLHCHTITSSHAYSTITELANAASELGLVALGVTDHGIAMSGAPHLWYFTNLKDLPDYILGVRVLRGVEVNIMGFDGRLDLENDILEKLEVVIASMHGGLMPAGNIEQCTAAWLAVAENPNVDIIGHSGSPEYEYNYEAVLPVIAKNKKAIELNEHSFKVRKGSIDNCRQIALLCKRFNVPVAVNSDSHYHDSVGLFPNCIQMLDEINFPSELIINSSVQNMNSFFSKKGIRF
ncbi:MAG: phosphatase [Oscillospiraceae bacterium]|nr:phosphatase [Oscillospiraceae bacterium]MDD4414738.1 phosphatase [Oscillospiraceae bacterium]